VAGRGDVAGRGLHHLGHPGVRQDLLGAAAVAGIGLAAQVAAPLEALDDVRQPRQRGAGHGGQLAHAQGPGGLLGQHRHDRVLEEVEVGVALQLGVQHRRQPAPPLFDDAPWIEQLFGWAQALPTPTAILIVSAHWESAPLSLSASAPGTQLVYDFAGFDRRYFEMTYPDP
jgi:hypothetical protein